MKQIIIYIFLCIAASASSAYGMQKLKDLLHKKTPQEKRAEIREERGPDLSHQEDTRLVRYCNTVAERADHPLNDELATHIQLSLQKFGADPNAVLCGAQYEMPLHAAASAAHTAPVIKTLLEFNADPNLRDSTGKTALHIACLHNNAQAIAILTQAGAVEQTDTRGNLPIHYAMLQKSNPTQGLHNKAFEQVTNNIAAMIAQGKIPLQKSAKDAALIALEQNPKIKITYQKEILSFVDAALKEKSQLPNDLIGLVVSYYTTERPDIESIPPLIILKTLQVPVIKESMSALNQLVMYKKEKPLLLAPHHSSCSSSSSSSSTQSRSALDGITRTEDEEEIQADSMREPYSSTSSTQSSRISDSSSPATDTTVRSLDEL